MTPWIFAQAEHLGSRREQQDRHAVLISSRTRECLLIVSDGVGGQEGGAVASQAVVDVAAKLWAAKDGRPVPPKEFLSRLCQTAHAEIVRRGQQLEVGPRATIAAVYLSNGHAIWAHSGDSRVYQFRDGVLVSRTRDHSVLQILVDRGSVREDEMGTHPDQGKLLQSLGGEEYKEPTFGSARTGPGDAFLLCTDGFWEHITPVEAAALVAMGPHMKQGMQKAVAVAAKRGGAKADNVTVAAVAVVGQKGLAEMLRNPVVAAAAGGLLLLLLILVIWASSSKSGSNGAKPTPIVDTTATGKNPGSGLSAGVGSTPSTDPKTSAGKTPSGVPDDFADPAAQARAAQEKAAQEKAAQDKAAREQAEKAERERAAQDRATQEWAAQQEKLARDRAALQKEKDALDRERTEMEKSARNSAALEDERNRLAADIERRKQELQKVQDALEKQAKKERAALEAARKADEAARKKNK